MNGRWLVILQAFLVAVQVFLVIIAPSPLVVAGLVFTALMFVVTLVFWMDAR
jgi:hypothetical protein